MHFVTILVCTPETATRTRVYTRQGVLMSPITPLATLVSNIVTRRIVAQDKRILESQAEQIALFGEPSRPTMNADAATRWLRRAMRTAQSLPASPVKLEEVQYRL